MMIPRSSDQLEGSLSRRVLVFQPSDTLVPCVSHFITFMWTMLGIFTPRRVALVYLVPQLAQF
jgi:hypothetical protein